MCSTLSALTGEQPAGGAVVDRQTYIKEVLMKLYIGISWSQSKHDICFINTPAAIQTQAVIQLSQKGFWSLNKGERGLEISQKLFSRIKNGTFHPD